MLRLSKSVQNSLILIDLLIKFCLEFFLGHTHKEVANELGNSLTDRPKSNLKDSVDPLPHLLHKNISPSRSICLVLVGLVLLLNGLTVLIVRLRHLFSLGHD